MSTDKIIEILRHHDNPCAVLERHAPLFEPFDLAAALEYAQAHYTRTPRIFTSLLVSGLNAICGGPCWWLMQEGAGPYPTNRTWGEYVPRALLYHVRMHINLANEVQSIRAYYLHQSRANSDALILALPFTYFHRMRRHPHFAHSQIYTMCLVEGLEAVGGRHFEEAHRYLGEGYDQDFYVMAIPLQSVTSCIERLLELLSGEEIVERSDGEAVPGLLARRVGARLGIPSEELEQWARCDYGEMYEDDDIPF